MKNTVLTSLAAAAAGAAIVLGISAASDDNQTPNAIAARPTAAQGQGPQMQGGQLPQQGQVPQQGGGQMPQQGGMPPGFGTPVTGADADKAAAAAKAKFNGTVERVMQLQDGSYVVHVITSGGEQHVLVSKDFKVTGADAGGPGAGGPPAGAANGAVPGSTSS